MGITELEKFRDGENSKRRIKLRFGSRSAGRTTELESWGMFRRTVPTPPRSAYFLSFLSLYIFNVYTEFRSWRMS